MSTVDRVNISSLRRAVTRARQTLLIAIAAAGFAAATTAPALAAGGNPDHWFDGALASGTAFSSGASHSWYRIEGDTTSGSGSQWCVGRLGGAGGRITSPGTSFCDAYAFGTQAVATYGGGQYHALANNYGPYSTTWTTATHANY